MMPKSKLRVIGALLLAKRGFAFEISTSPLQGTTNKVFVVNTCSRGIGLEFANQLVTRSDDSALIIGLHRTKTEKLMSLQQSFPNKFKLVQVDTESQASIDAAASSIKQLTKKVDLLINSAGILGDGKTTPGPERSLQNMNREWFEKTMQVNLIGHVMMTQALLPLLKNNKIDPANLTKIINISARVGSIEDNNLGGWYSYRMSKSALNMFTKTASIELKRYGCIVLSMHPGTTDTDLSIPFQKNVVPEKLFPVSYSVNQMLEVIWKSGVQDSGKIFAYDGTIIPY